MTKHNPEEQNKTDIMSQSPKKTIKKSKYGRCAKCRVKLKAYESALRCKCGNTYCSMHRLSPEHDCSYDHKTYDKSVLEKRLVACVKAKIDVV